MVEFIGTAIVCHVIMYNSAFLNMNNWYKSLCVSNVSMIYCVDGVARVSVGCHSDSEMNDNGG